MASLPKTKLTPEQYLEMERAAEFKSEYVGGEMVARLGASRTHNLITANLIASLVTQLRTRDCEAYASDMRINVGAVFYYPDVVVVCGEIKLLDDWRDTLLNPTLIFEVLSKSTEAYDRGEKFARYSQIATLQDYVLVSQDQYRIEHFMRQDGDKWLLSVYTSADSVVELGSIGGRLAVEDVYRRVVFEAAQDQ